MTDSKKKLDILKASFEAGVIDKKEYEKKKEKLESDAKEFDDKIENFNQKNTSQEEHFFADNKPKISSEKILLISISVIILLFISILAYSIFNKPAPKTLEDMHLMNLKGRLKPEQGYVYKGVYSFINFDNLWYTELKSSKGTKVYSLALRYSPRDLDGIVIEGSLNTKLFNEKNEFFATFNPTGKDFSYVALAAADFNTHMSKVFEKNPIAACDRNETEACKTRPIVSCEDADKLVLYIKEANRFRAYYNDNCIVVEGNGLDLIKGVDRVLYNLYNIMEQEE